jgi:hypothetical protein
MLHVFASAPARRLVGAWAAAGARHLSAPPAAGAGLAAVTIGVHEPARNTFGILERVWEGMGTEAQDAARKAAIQRAGLSGVPLLRALGGTMPAAGAAPGLTVLAEDERSGKVSIGYFELPKLDGSVQLAPKSEFFCRMCRATAAPFGAVSLAFRHHTHAHTHRGAGRCRRSTRPPRLIPARHCPDTSLTSAAYGQLTNVPHQAMLLFPQRLHLAAEFVADVQACNFDSGVLLSGPSGVGKSGVGLLSYLLCAARRLPVAYISGAAAWVQEAKFGDTGGRGGDAFFLSQLWMQNADLIAASDVLSDVFRAAMHDEADSFTPQVMAALRKAVGRHKLGVGVIID